MLKLYNTLTRSLEDFPLKEGEVSYYSCGPTVYDYAHLGHARTYIFADILERVLQFNMYTVHRVMNITDVGHLTSDSDTGEDKLEKGAKRENKSVWDIAKFYTDDFLSMLRKLNIKIPDDKDMPRATDYIPQMISLVKKLEEKGYTYTIADGVYFDTSKFPKYGELTGMTLEKLEKNLQGGARVEMVDGKKHVTDFALWKLTPKGVARQMEWESPWGKGFPGWHIECSAMATSLLGETLDIHTGGVDHIPIHHTNEIAQSEAATGKEFVKHWLHSDHLLIDGTKMSKSLGNFYKLSDVEKKGFDPLALRYLFLTAHYRTQMNFTWESLGAASNAYTLLKHTFRSIKIMLTEKKIINSLSLEAGKEYIEKFHEAINNDLGTPQAVAVMWNMINSLLNLDQKYLALLEFDKVLGLNLDVINIDIPSEILSLGKERDRLRREKKYKEADDMRKKIEEAGFIVMDTKEGTKIT